MNEYKKALELIKKNQGKVCQEFELCDHISCGSSYASWAIADAALSEIPLSELFDYDDWENELDYTVTLPDIAAIDRS